MTTTAETTTAETTALANLAIGEVLSHLTWLHGVAPNRHWIVWVRTIEELAEHSAVPLKKWMHAHHDDTVMTAQFTISPELPVSVRSAWLPPYPRLISAGATFATLSGSRRDYAGMIAIAATDHSWIGYDCSMNTVVVYELVEGGPR